MLKSEKWRNVWLREAGTLGGRARDGAYSGFTDQVIREDPSAARGVAGAPKNRQRILSVHRSGWSRNAGPQQWYGGIRSTLDGTRSKYVSKYFTLRAAESQVSSNASAGALLEKMFH